MRRIYLVLFIIGAIFCLAIGYHLGSGTQVDTDLAKIRHERDSLSILLSLSIQTQEKLVKIALAERSAYERKDSVVKDLERKLEKQGETLQKQIDDIRKFTYQETDSFLTSRYPAPRQSFNRSTRPIEMPEWRANEIAVDLGRLDSASQVVESLVKIKEEQKIAIVHRDNEIRALSNVIVEKDKAFSIVLSREGTLVQEIDYWKRQDKKHKRQRDAIIVGVGAVVAASIYNSFR